MKYLQYNHNAIVINLLDLSTCFAQLEMGRK